MRKQHYHLVSKEQNILTEISHPGADLGFFVLQSKKIRTGRGQRRAWWTPRVAK